MRGDVNYLFNFRLKVPSIIRDDREPKDNVVGDRRSGDRVTSGIVQDNRKRTACSKLLLKSTLVFPVMYM